MNEERCELCLYFRNIKGLVSGEWRHFHFCSRFINQDFCIVVEPNDRCEMFCRKEDK